MQLIRKRNPIILLRGLIGRLVGGVFLVMLLLSFLIMMRLLDAKRIPDRTIRTMETVPEMAPPPPPPLEIQEETPPPPPPPLPKLELQIESVAPPLVATLDSNIDFTMRIADFELESNPEATPSSLPIKTPKPAKPSPISRPKVQGLVSVGDLDSRPRLMNRPSTRYPSALLRRGVRSGTVILEVGISMNGRVNVRKVFSSSHPELTKMATSFASRARFSVPRKDGQPVNAIYRWPMTLQPPK
ncbi:MAG: energy transducer TonB [Verrucomicrobiales bacterium]|nr:energy transducer TonB [Verrucomicrobiales bacterium]